jgi:sulfane dehydrogenase subunit SoxC
VITRRTLLVNAGTVGGALLTGLAPDSAPPQSTPPSASAPPPPPAPSAPDDPTSLLGAPTSGQGARSPFEAPSRTPTGDTAGSSLTPHGALHGTITPADLHFERHHSGVPLIDPARHRLMLHGMVARPLAFSVEDLRRFPQVTRPYFVECAGNGRAAYRNPTPELTAQRVAGLASNTEWTGVPLRYLLDEAGVDAKSTWCLAEGSDSCLMARSIPVSKLRDDALIVWAQNGEPLRPAQGYPMRLLLPGWEGNSNVKWLRRLEFGTAPWMTRWETSKYTDVLPNGTARIFSFEQDAKSVITSPSHPDVVAAQGWLPVRGIAWSGRGTITRVEVSTDGGTTWHDAELCAPPTPKAHVRFQHMWKWTGGEALLLSRATDDTGYVQPTRTALLAARGIGTDYHCNQIVGWKVQSDGRVFFHGLT